jgi:ribose transport system ATP-binding protein
MYQHSQYLLRSLGLEIDPNTRVRELSVGERQIVEIARALSHESDIIIMDEPNSALTDQETQTLFEIIRNLKERGVTIIFVSHRLEEVFCIADRISILRDGRYIGTEITNETTISKVISSIIGREMKELFPPRPQRDGSAKPVLEVKGVAKHGQLQPIDFQVFEGEILGFAGLEGCGREDLFRGLFGLETFDQGEIFYLGRRVDLRSASDAIKLGWGLIPPDRRELGLMLNWPILDNTVLIILDQIRTLLGLIDRHKARDITERLVDELSIETDSVYKQVANLSGGNQQKVLLAKWLATNPKVLILDDPTRGIDVGSKSEIYRLMDKLSREGVAILFTSSELDEIIGMSDRIIVLYKGYKVLECSRGEVTKEEILHYVNGKGLVGGVEPEYSGEQEAHKV